MLTLVEPTLAWTEVRELVLSAVMTGKGAEPTLKRWLKVWLEDIVLGVDGPEWGWRRDDDALGEVGRLAALKCAIHASEEVKLDAVTKSVSGVEEVGACGKSCVEAMCDDSVSLTSPSDAVWYGGVDGREVMAEWYVGEGE
jgi:hypothetical protein